MRRKMHIFQNDASVTNTKFNAGEEYVFSQHLPFCFLLNGFRRITLIETAVSAPSQNLVYFSSATAKRKSSCSRTSHLRATATYMFFNDGPSPSFEMKRANSAKLFLEDIFLVQDVWVLSLTHRTRVGVFFCVQLVKTSNVGVLVK